MVEPRSIGPRHAGGTPLLKVEAVAKSFGGVRALRGVNLAVHAGQVHALLGENGAGKSTLIKILCGVQSRDRGTIEIDGEAVSFQSAGQARDAGVAVVYQDLSLIESLTVADNLMLGREPATRFGLLRKRKLLAEAEAFLAGNGFPLDPRATVGALAFAFRQMTEIAKALMGRVRLLILDEPTSALTGDEEKILFDAVRAVTARGVGVIYVTHRLNEVFRISQRVTVLRDGSNAGTFETADTSMQELVAAIVGPKTGRLEEKAPSDLEAARAQPAAPGRAAPVLELRGVSNGRLDRVDLAVAPGEIHGLAGLIGSGRTEILETIFGLRPVRSGDLALNGSTLVGLDPARAIGLGMALVPEDRHGQGLVLDHSIERNLTLPRLPAYSRWGWFRSADASKRAGHAFRSLAVKAPGLATTVKNLSGGNQQKVVFGKWSEPSPKLLLLDEPTIGVDVGAREEIYAIIRRAADAGSGVLLVSSDLAELTTLCDRISIVVGGRILQTLTRGELEGAEALHHLIQTLQTTDRAA